VRRLPWLRLQCCHRITEWVFGRAAGLIRGESRSLPGCEKQSTAGLVRRDARSRLSFTSDDHSLGKKNFCPAAETVDRGTLAGDNRNVSGTGSRLVDPVRTRDRNGWARSAYAMRFTLRLYSRGAWGHQHERLHATGSSSQRKSRPCGKCALPVKMCGFFGSEAQMPGSGGNG
jgi:hypothetical protein